MRSSIFNVRVPLEAPDEVFLMNTLTDAQMVVSRDVVALLDEFAGELGGPADLSALDKEGREAVELLQENGFLVESHAADRRRLDEYFTAVRDDASELHITVLTTLQCNFACDYCFQGDHGDYNKFAEKMTMETAARVGDWIEGELDSVHPEKLTLMFFGGEPLLNLPVMYYLAERMWGASGARGVPMAISVITNGLLLTSEVVDRLLPYGLNGFKITLDGDRDAHNRMRPMRGGQGTFDRIVENIRKVAGRTNIAIGGNFDESSVDSYGALLEFLRKQDFADKIYNVAFKPIVRYDTPAPKGIFPLIPVGANGKPVKPLGGTCMSNVGEGGGQATSACGSCNFLDDKMEFLRQETKRHGFSTPDGVHNGPCHIHRKNAQTIGPDGSLYACPGFTGEQALSIGHIDGRHDAARESAFEKFERLHPWDECKDCAFIPTCAGGCLTASHAQLGDVNLPTCHKSSFESALISLAHDASSAPQERVQ
jgi:uncharacterized protein